MTVVITFSGMAGTGKSNCSRYIAKTLNEKGLPVYNVRFRQLRIKTLFEPDLRVTDFWFEKVEPITLREVPLTHPVDHLEPIWKLPLKFPYYLYKSFLFKLLLFRRHRNHIVICDRYLYDSLVHFKLTDKKWRWVFRLFLKVLPRPDLPIALTAPVKTIRHARPMFGVPYIESKLNNYKALAEIDPDIRIVGGENIHEILDNAEKTVNEFLKAPNIFEKFSEEIEKVGLTSKQG
ncbi:MAG: dTMP kinase [Calditrichia bacterium]